MGCSRNSLAEKGRTSLREGILKDSRLAGNMACVLTIVVWGTTAISTKVLLEAYTPVELLVTRFVVALVALYIACPRPLKGTTPREELYMVLAGLCGICLYFLFESLSLLYSSASNVGVIISFAPFFTAFFSWVFLKETRPSIWYCVGFIVAISGICIMSFAGSQVEASPMGDLLAFVATIVWGLYNVLTKMISQWGQPTILTTRRIFVYGLAFLVPCSLLSDFHWSIAPLADPVNLFNLLYLGCCAGALCFVTWNYALKVLGPVRTTLYLYAEPVVTLVAAMLFLGERLSMAGILGATLAILGSVISRGFKDRKKARIRQDSI